MDYQDLNDHDLLIRIDEHTKTHTIQLTALEEQINTLQGRMTSLETSRQKSSTADQTVRSEETERRNISDRTWRIIAVCVGPATAISFKAMELIWGVFSR